MSAALSRHPARFGAGAALGQQPRSQRGRPAARPPQPGRQRGRPVAVAAAAAAAAAALPSFAEAAAVVAALPDELPPWALPLAGAGLVTAVVSAARLSTYSQREYITASMLARHVKAGGARVLQLGGSTRDLYYYPAGTVQVTVAGPDLNAGLWEQAGVQAKVPVVVSKGEPQKALAAAAPASADSVVLLNQLAVLGDLQAATEQAHRVLKPGGTLVFVQRLPGGPVQAVLASGQGAVEPTQIDLVQMFEGWDFVQVDAAMVGTDPHAVGVCVKPLAAPASAPAEASVDASAFEQLMMMKMRRAGGGAGGGEGAGGGGKAGGGGGGGGFGPKP